MKQFDPQRPDFKPYGLTCVSWAPGPMRRADHHNEIELNLLRSGSVTYLLAGSKVKISACQLAAFWASIPHQVIDYEENTNYHVVTIPFAWFLQFKLPEAFTRTLLRGCLLKENLSEKREFDYTLFADWEADLAQSNPETQDIVLLELHARLHRMALRVADDCTLEHETDSPIVKLQDGSLNKVEQIACYIAQNYLEPLSATQIGEAVGIHPNYAMSLFKKAFGTTLVNYLTHHRISHAQRLLVTTDQKILDIAMESGFHTLSRFNSAFRQTCGCSPREYRSHQSIQAPTMPPMRA